MEREEYKEINVLPHIRRGRQVQIIRRGRQVQKETEGKSEKKE
jgi:hypothetical protein